MPYVDEEPDDGDNWKRDSSTDDKLPDDDALNERLDKALTSLSEEWDSVIIIATGYRDSKTLYAYRRQGNSYAAQQSLARAYDEF